MELERRERATPAGGAEQREKARELGPSLVLGLHRLLKTSQLHAIGNMAVVQLLEQSSATLRHFSDELGGEAVSLLFAKNTVFVAGQLLKASRTEYGAALELGAMFERFGVSEIVFRPDVEPADLTALLQAWVAASKPGAQDRSLGDPSQRIRLRSLSAAALLEDEDRVGDEERIARAYASAVVVMRRVLDNVRQGKLELPQQAKRIAQKLVMLAEGDTPAFLGVTAMRNANHDAAGRSVNTAILAVSMARMLSDDLGVIARIAMAALLADVGARLLAEPQDELGAWASDALDPRRVPAATALALVAMSGLREAATTRAVIAHEALWHSRSSEIGPAYEGLRDPTVAARLVAVARRFNDLLTPDPAAERFTTPDAAVAILRHEARDGIDRTVVSVLVGAIGMFPSGTPVELDNGERGIVAITPSHPLDYPRPVVRVLYGSNGGRKTEPVDVDLRIERTRSIVAVVPDPDEPMLAAGEALYSVKARPSLLLMPSGELRAVTTFPPAGRAPHDRPTVRPERMSGGVSLGVPRPGAIPALELSPGDDFPIELADSRWPLAEHPVAHSEPAKQPSVFVTSVSKLIEQDLAATAQGSLERTPLAHLLVYVLDNSLSGTLVFTAPSPDGPVEHGVHCSRGVPDKVCTATRVAPLGPLLQQRGVVVPRGALSDEILVGYDEGPLEQALLARNAAALAPLIDARAQQVRERIRHLFGLPPETHYAFFLDTDLLETRVGRVGVEVSPLALLADGLRAHPVSQNIDAALASLGDQPLLVHPEADLAGFELTDAEQSVLAAAGSGPTLSELTARPELDARMVRVVVYLLLICRSLQLGGRRSPLRAE